jgi:hypothetical protein
MKEIRQLPIVVALAALALGAIVVGDRDADRPAPAADARDAAAIASAGTQSSAWFCPGAPPPVAADRETISIANTGDRVARVDVTLWPDDGTDPQRSQIDVAARSVTVVGRASLGVPGGVVVETFSRSVVVESGIEAGDQLAVNACASMTSPEWYFASGTTVRGAEQWLVLFNPLGTDAKVDVSVATQDGRQSATALVGLDVPRRSRVMRKINDDAQNSARVGLEVEARVGRVVAEQVMLRAEASGAIGTTRTLGAVEAGPEWSFPFAQSVNGSNTSIAVTNPGARDAEISVQVVTTNADLVVPPFETTVAVDQTIAVQVGGCAGTPDEACVPMDPDLTYSVQVSSDVDHPIVAEQIVSRADAGVEAGVSATPGTPRGASRWVFARSRVAEERATIFAIVNPSGQAVEASFALVREGRVEELPELQGIAVAPSRPTTVTLSELVADDAAVVVTATGPVAVQRSLWGAAEQSAAPGVPDRSS